MMSAWTSALRTVEGVTETTPVAAIVVQQDVRPSMSQGAMDVNAKIACALLTPSVATPFGMPRAPLNVPRIVTDAMTLPEAETGESRMDAPL